MNERMQAIAGLEQATASFQLTVDQPFPPYLGHELIQRYQNVFCTVLRVPGGHGSQRNAAYIAGKGDGPSTIILYRRDGDRITVVNEYFSIEADELGSMAHYLFARHPEVNVIVLEAVAVGPGRLPFLHQRFNASEDIVISLPATPQAYGAALGRNTRAAIRRCQRLLAERAHPIDFSFHDKGDAGRDSIAELVELSSLRIAGKRQVPSHTEYSVAQLRRMVESHGVTLLARSEGRVRGGVICTHLGSHFYMHVIAHDRAFDDLRLGLLCCYLSIGEAIRRGAAEYHLLSGRYAYKYRLLGEQRDFDRIVMYRSPRGVAVNLPLYARTLVRGGGRAARQRLKAWRETWKN